MAESSRAFLIRRLWLAWTLVVIALLYFAAVVTLVVLDYRVQGVSYEMLALGGAGLFGLVALVLVFFLLRKRKPRAPRAAQEAEPSFDDAPVATRAFAASAPADDEVRLTDDSAQGLRVLEYSRPAKSRNRNAVYTKTHVPVSQAHVLRVETMVADASDL